LLLGNEKLVRGARYPYTAGEKRKR
jgi:hypothetical protein